MELRIVESPDRFGIIPLLNANNKTIKSKFIYVYPQRSIDGVV